MVLLLCHYFSTMFSGIATAVALGIRTVAFATNVIVLILSTYFYQLI